MTSNPPQRKVTSNKEASDWDADTHTPAELQSGNSSMQSLPCKETFMDTLEESVGLGSQDMVQIHMGNDDLD